MTYLINNTHHVEDTIIKEFCKIKNEDVEVEVDELSLSYANYSKNRYTNIYPFKDTVFRLSKIDNDENSIYINANYVQCEPEFQKYISTQAPPPETFRDFWRMVWESNASVILMLTKLIENGNYKADKYWPEKINMYKNITVENIEEIQFSNNITIRIFHISKGEENSRTIYQIHCSTWSDYCSPNSTKTFKQLHDIVNTYSLNKEVPIIAHCSAGVGRTGTFVALSQCFEYFEINGCVDIKQTVSKMRRQRVGMVQTYKQYLYIYKCISEFLFNHVDF